MTGAEIRNTLKLVALLGAEDRSTDELSRLLGVGILGPSGVSCCLERAELFGAEILYLNDADMSYRLLNWPAVQKRTEIWLELETKRTLLSPPTVSASEFARINGVHPSLIRALLKKGRIEGAKLVGGAWEIPTKAQILPSEFDASAPRGPRNHLANL